MNFKKILKSPCFYFIMLLPLGLLLLAAARFVPGFADFYYRTFYRFFGGIFGSITGIFPFSLMEAGICVLVFLAIYSIHVYNGQKHTNRRWHLCFSERKSPVPANIVNLQR